MMNQDQIATECVYCGGYLHAGKYPPLCSDYCIYWFNVEVEFSKWAREELEKWKRKQKSIETKTKTKILVTSSEV